MHRRDFMMLLGGTAAAHSLAARAEQPERMRQIGWLVGLREQDPEAQSRDTVIVRALSDLGWIVGRNLHIEYRYLVGDSQRFDIQAAELVALAPDVLIANSTPATRALQQASSTIPIVFVQVLDPVGSGVVTRIWHGRAAT
jgi:putative tryptophan/tyrosine transport system substrate-binding protein